MGLIFRFFHAVGFLQLGALYSNIRHDPRSEYNQWKSECSERQWSWGVWKCSEIPAGVLWAWSTLRKFLGSKEHLDWFKIDFNAGEIITVQDFKHKKN